MDENQVIKLFYMALWRVHTYRIHPHALYSQKYWCKIWQMGPKLDCKNIGVLEFGGLVRDHHNYV